MTDDTVLYEVSKGVARIILNRPAVNALNLEMIKGVVAALETAAKDESIRAVVLASAVPKAFSAGLDLNILLGKSEQKVRGLVQELYVRL
ncbi:MAG: enoyl-CoA hydratase/isomerase family protein, partial [Pseudolabrys sp.]